MHTTCTHGTQNPKILVLNLYLDMNEFISCWWLLVIVVLLVSLVTVGRRGLSVVT